MTDPPTYAATRRRLAKYVSDALPPGLDVSVELDDATGGIHLVLSRAGRIVGAEVVELWAPDSVREAWLRLRARAWAAAAPTTEGA
jgi:hypothetical protein